ncbi:Uncharacterized protein SCF082_LOCUS22708 [Durusdinium trenchii]|uniref:Uncharacterized protein n=1 Tax=Durusdinium trenchii TaxID=1381693 RepID=A0ABP0LJ59_9DINO
MATPPPRVKRSDTAVSDPKQSARRKQLEHVSPRTMHYSPEADHGEGAEKCVGCEEAECIVCREADMGLKSKRKKPASPALSRAEVPEPAKVSSALHRAATVNVPDASSSGKKVPKPIAPASPVNDDDDDQELTLEMMRARKAAHARFMRFSRSSEKLALLYEQRVQCEGHWKESSFVKELRVTNRSRKKGARKWMTKQELIQKFGSERLAMRIIEAKQNDPVLAKSQIRCHPDCPDEPELVQYLVWDMDAEEDTEDIVTNNLFQAVDDDGNKGGKEKKSKSKKKSKRPTSSSSSSCGSDSGDSSGSSSSATSDSWFKYNIRFANSLPQANIVM